ncbi:MAG TPA: hypothetical protein VKT28_20895 [Puia sp.]|nr:hypothetical protein [Puia sp.]
MRCLLFISSLFFLQGCSSLYNNLQKTETDKTCLQKFKPKFSSALYSAKIDVVGKHLSGLLVIKKMPDSSTRIVFSNEMGFTFFDFEFQQDGNFVVHSIIKQMDKKAVKKTLRKDFELVLMQNLENKTSYSFKDSSFLYTAFPQTKGTYYYITDLNCSQLVKMQRASKSKAVVEAIMENYVNDIPDTIDISHKNFQFDIGLKKLER